MYQVNIKHFYMIEYIEDGKVMNVEVDLREPIAKDCHRWRKRNSSGNTYKYFG